MHRASFIPIFKKFLNQSDIAFEKWWICFFAPSAAAFAVPILKDFFDLPAPNAGRDLSASTDRVAAIGPTTSSFLRNDLGIYVDVVSLTPTPEDTVVAIVNHESTSHGRQ